MKSTDYYLNINEFIEYYNEVRPHQGIGYEVSKSRYSGFK